MIQPIAPEHFIARISTRARGEESAGSGRIVVDGSTVEAETTSAAEG